jgi:hypothetical protein
MRKVLDFSKALQTSEAKICRWANLGDGIVAVSIIIAEFIIVIHSIAADDHDQNAVSQLRNFGGMSAIGAYYRQFTFPLRFYSGT